MSGKTPTGSVAGMRIWAHLEKMGFTKAASGCLQGRGADKQNVSDGHDKSIAGTIALGDPVHDLPVRGVPTGPVKPRSFPWVARATRYRLSPTVVLLLVLTVPVLVCAGIAWLLASVAATVAVGLGWGRTRHRVDESDKAPDLATRTIEDLQPN